MARKTKYDNIDEIMGSASMAESKIFSHAKNEVGDIIEIDVNKITDNPYQPRLILKNDSLIDLVNSIQENGLLQPIALNKLSNKKYEIVAGHRRVSAHKILKKSKIKAIIISELSKDNDEYKSKMSSIALIENLQREDLDILEIALSFQNIINEKIFKTKGDLAKSIGKSSAYISKVTSILKLSDDIIKDLEINKTIKDIETLYELQKIEDKELQLSLYEEIVKGKLSRQELREYNKKRTITKVTIPKTQTITQNKYKIVKSTISTSIKFESKNLDDKKFNELTDKITLILEEYL